MKKEKAKKKSFTLDQAIKTVGGVSKRIRKAGIGKFIKKRQTILASIFFFCLPLLIIFVFKEISIKGIGFSFSRDYLPPQQAQKLAKAFISQKFFEGKEGLEVTNIERQGEIYQFQLKPPDQERTFNSYISKDGRFVFPEGYKTEEVRTEVLGTKSQENSSEEEGITKSDRPQIELFVMSFCPYGTQAEKGLLPVVKLLKNKIDFHLRFVDYAMHGKEELDEQLKEYCLIQKEPEKLFEYLECFLKSENKGEVCLDEIQANRNQLNTCIRETDEEFKITANYNDKSTWKGQYPLFSIHKDLNEKYGVGGSPALVINGKEAQSSRNPAAYLKTICSYFEKQPAECEEKLSETTPQPGFGTATSDNASEASCN